MGTPDALPVGAINKVTDTEADGVRFLRNTNASGSVLPPSPALSIPAEDFSVEPCQTSHVSNILSVDCLGAAVLQAKAISAWPHNISDMTVTVDEPTSPLLHMPLYSAAASQMKVFGIHSSSNVTRTAAPLATAMLTPVEPPSPFPGFPSLSAYKTPRSDGDIAVVKAIGVEPTTPKTTSSAPAQSDGKSASSWGSSRPSVGSQSHGSLTPCVPVAEAGGTERDGCSQLSAGVNPWPLSYPRSLTPASSSASDVAGGDIVIFDLNHFDDNGEEVNPTSSVVKGSATIDPPNKDAISAPRPNVPRRYVKLRFPTRKAAPASHNVATRGLDVYRQDVFPAGSNSSKTNKPLVQLTDVQGGNDEGTPTWPPLVPRGPAPGLDDADDTESVVKSLLLDAPAANPTYACSAAPDHPCSPPTGVDGRGVRQSRQEPGRDYAAVAAATSVLLSTLKSHAKAAVLAACAGDEPTLRTAQDHLHAVTVQLLDLDLAPHSYTASGACKALAYSTATTPVSGLPVKSFHVHEHANCGNDASGGESWTSIGSQIIQDESAADSEGSICQPARTSPLGNDTVLSPNQLIPFQTTAPPLAGSSAVRTGTVEGDVWDNGPLHLPSDTDSYLAGLRARDVSSSACVLASLQSSLSFTSLLINSACRQLYLAREETAELRARAGALAGVEQGAIDRKDFGSDVADSKTCAGTCAGMVPASNAKSYSVVDEPGEGLGEGEGAFAAEALLKLRRAAPPGTLDGTHGVIDNASKDLANVGTRIETSQDQIQSRLRVAVGDVDHESMGLPMTPPESCYTPESLGSGCGSCEGPSPTKLESVQWPEKSSGPRRLWRSQGSSPSFATSTMSFMGSS